MDAYKINPKNKILLIELYGHVEVVFVMARQILEKKDTAIIITTNEIYEEIKNLLPENSIQWIRLKKNKFTSIEAKTIALCSESADESWILTAEGHFDFWNNIKFGSHLHYLVHNINFATGNHKFKIKNTCSIRYLHHFSKHILSKNQKLALLDKADRIMFPSYGMLSHFKKTNPQDQDRSFYLSLKGQDIPRPSETPHPPYQIGILGSIQSENRDYTLLLEALENMSLAFLNRYSVEFIFLGAPRGRTGKKIAKTVKKIAQKRNIKIRIPQISTTFLRYQEMLSMLHVAIIPAKQNIRFGIFEEILEHTSSLGSMTDAARLDIPILMPTGIPEGSHAINPLRRYFHAQSLEAEIIQIIEAFENQTQTEKDT